MCNNKEKPYSAENIKAVVIKTMDTGPSVEDMYAEIHMEDAIYIVLSESPLFKDIILDTLSSVIPINLELFIKASMYHFDKTFILYKKDGLYLETEDSVEKKIAILEEAISLFRETKQPSLSGFIFAIMSFCPMYLLYGKGEHKNMLVTLSDIDENLIPIYTTPDKCPPGDQFEKIRLSADQYVKLLVYGNNDVVVNFNTNYQIVLSSHQLKNVLLPLIALRDDLNYPKTL